MMHIRNCLCTQSLIVGAFCKLCLSALEAFCIQKKKLQILCCVLYKLFFVCLSAYIYICVTKCTNFRSCYISLNKKKASDLLVVFIKGICD